MRYKATFAILYIAISMVYTAFKIIQFIGRELFNYIYY